MNKTKRYEILSRLRDNNPNPTTELEYDSPFQLLIAVLLSAQATDVGVNKATRKLFPAAPTAETMLALGVDGIKEYIKTIGLFNSKAENAYKTCKILVQEYGGEVPEDRSVFRYFAAIFLNQNFAGFVSVFGFGIKQADGFYVFFYAIHTQS